MEVMHYEIFQHEPRPDCHYVAAAFWESREDFARDKPPRLINDFRMQVDHHHQRIARGPRGGLLHACGTEILPHEQRSFLESESLQWERDNNGRVVTDGRGRWIPRRGAPLAPFLLRGRRLDPQWNRERFTQSIESQVAANLVEYWRRAAARDWRGDRRGTTLNLQVGANADDGYSSPYTYADNNSIFIGEEFLGTWLSAAFRFTGVSGLSGATINSAILTAWGGSGTTGSAQSVLKAEKAAAPGAIADESDFGSRVRTTASQTWNDASTFTNAAWNDSPGFAAVIQEVANLYNPSTLMIFWEDNGSGFEEMFEPTPYNISSSHATKLAIDYTAAGGGGSSPVCPRPTRLRPLFRR